MSLNKIDLVINLIEKLGLSKQDSASAVEATFEIMRASLESGNDVKISRFGKWSVKAKKARKGRNPKTGESMIVTARNVVTFKPSPTLRDEING